jgi:hypothetical protein
MTGGRRRATHLQASDVHGASRLAVEATLALTSLVENLHHNIARLPGPLGRTSHQPARGITGLVYRSIRGVTRTVGAALDAVLGSAAAVLGSPDAVASGQRDAVLAALNGVLGDHLAATGNPLAIRLTVRHLGQPLPHDPAALQRMLSDPSPRVLLMVHGLCMSLGQWRRGGRDHGATLAAEGGFTLLHLHYNTGLHVSDNGRQLADLLDVLQRAWPVPIEDLAIVGHSMGGLVARSACHQAIERGDAWPAVLSRLVFIGTPHHGAPLERGGQRIDSLLGASPYTAAFARLGRLRSAGITDLRHGSLLEADHAGPDRFAHRHDTRRAVPLPAGVRCYAIAGSLGRGRAAGALLGDGLVPLDSALGRHRDRHRQLKFGPGRRWIAEGTGHLDLLGDDAVLDRLRRWLLVAADRRTVDGRRDGR